MRIWHIILISLSLLLASCNLSSADNADTEVEIIPETIPTNIDNLPLGGEIFTIATQSYIDNNLGITFDYPEGWFISDFPPTNSVAYAISIYSYDAFSPNPPPRGQNEGNFPTDETKFEIYVDLNEQFSTIDELLESIANNSLDTEQTQIIEQHEWTTTFGAPAVWISGIDRMGSAYQNVVMQVNNHIIQIVAYGDDTLFEAFIASIQPIS